ncbi:MAG: hypothetical protein KDA53_02090 [Hyphomonas sp.]|nr:hypothetical protein [Hyphomonas sp.]
MEIAYLASAVTLPGSPVRRPDAFEHDRMMTALRGPFAERGMSVEDISWDDPAADWASYGAVIIGTTWDYSDRQAEFLSQLAVIEANTRLFNPAALVAWNIHKGYLRDLESRGARLIPTLWLETADAVTGPAAFDRLGSDDLVFKRQVGAGADGQYRLRRGDPIPHMPYPMMVQPFLPAIQVEGEYSFIFIGGQFCHALVKNAVAGEYRIQSSYGGRETVIDPEADDLAEAARIVAMLDEAPLYARVDMLRGDDDALRLMELELIEPYLYPLEGPDLGPIMAAEVQRRLTGSYSPSV